MKQSFFNGLAWLALPCCVACSPVSDPDMSPVAAVPDGPRNVILMIGDGMGFAQVKAYRYYADNPATPLIEPLPFDRYLVGAVATESLGEGCAADSVGTCTPDPYDITDSASAATAYATGQDTLNGWESLSPAGEIQPSITEAARRHGKSVGLVATVQLSHATPAAFSAHVKSRYDTDEIADQLFDNQWDRQPLVQVLLGGGAADLQREDRNIAAEFEQAGYTLVTNRDQLLQANAPRLLGLFAPWGLARAWDREASVPSLADMTRAALQALEQNPEGFFLMVEGSQIDWAGHVNDVAGVVSEMGDFSAAIEVVLEFAAARGDTLVVVTADHETGGMSLGIDGIYRWDPRPLRGMQQTPERMTMEFLDGTDTLSDVVARSVPFELTAEERVSLDSQPRDRNQDPADGVDGLPSFIAVNELLSRRTLTGWSSGGHTGVDVPLYAVGPGSENFHGVMQNEEVGRQLQALLIP